MNGLIKNVFLMIMGVTVAGVLYVILFGSIGLSGQTIEMSENTGYSDRGMMRNWKGALWYAAEMVETPISRYYQMYCLVPNLHVNDYVDEALGADIAQSPDRYVPDTPADLEANPDPTIANWNHSGPRWDTGWY